ncbi:40S ribosomal protein S17 [Mycena leptocephala]|nr:40S ribosomal protein S17 [Mycena leptocephala]
MTFVGHHTVADRTAEAAVGVQLQHLTLDFHTNKCIIDDVAVVSSKQLHNKISGFTTHLLKRIQKGPVHGMSFELQEEERERKDNYVPEIDPDTKALLTVLNFDLMPISVVVPITTQPERSGPGGGPRQEKRIVLGTAPQ